MLNQKTIAIVLIIALLLFAAWYNGLFQLNSSESLKGIGKAKLNGKKGYIWSKIMTAREVCAMLERNEWTWVRTAGSHRIYEKNRYTCVVPYHNGDLDRGTLKSIKQQAEP
jgi:predicted RNA binding protein YcfA (HicA-like mRNA interferase family)